MTREEAINNLKKILGFSPTYDEAFYTLFQNGVEPSLPSDVDEAAENYIAPIENDEGLDYINFNGRDIKDAFKAGAEWQKTKMLEGAVEGKVVEGYGCEKGEDGVWRKVVIPTIRIEATNFSIGDKVKVIVVKEGQK